MKCHFILATVCFSLLLLASVILSGCGNSSEPAQPTSVSYSNPFFPLELGNYWIYGRALYPGDSIYRAEVMDTVNFMGNIYYKLITTYYDTSYYFRVKNDTSYLRFKDNNMLVRYIAGNDSAYIDFATTTKYMTGEGPHFPGLVYQYPAYDSTSVGEFDSCKVIAFHQPEVDYSTFVRNIGAIEKGYDPLITLVRAKVGRVYFP